ncbi:Golgi apparatus membrane protein TVP23 homolog B [Eurytemora carolleeae]|uniref:Golgi apparatus membrane protein TVP23 homolog B n=1 Tax=Eurytemora carolleeae TaxID=1294199 RepID=UPI000C762439|nr:Golgi apparatus membrane protein TVP23 homolog B [Eurytemora carolleeae]XP_023333806.1 Golgi apparatus membrane protein TVP23 homolog B [Eurytemora carolleeae]|eukprot:XP_023333805.1 Golgi apparatus membrane protein TVP23 homolog B-like [Eurytemora affinis]
MTGYTRLQDEDLDTRSTVNASISNDRIIEQKQGRPSHTMILVLHLMFKMMSLALYMFGWLLTSSFIACFIMITLLLSADFWIVKNISGRLLAGLRWWSVVEDDGKLSWRYECWTSEERELAKSKDSNIFWGGLIVAQGAWFIFATISLFSLHLRWFLLCSVALSLNGANLFGSLRCRLGQVNIRQKVTEYITVNVLKRSQSNTQQNI